MGLDYCHKMGVVNRDIKLENTLLDGSPKPLVKITDFGYCKSDKESLPKSKVGTPGYTGTLLLPSGDVPGEQRSHVCCGTMCIMSLVVRALACNSAHGAIVGCSDACQAAHMHMSLSFWQSWLW